MSELDAFNAREVEKQWEEPFSYQHSAGTEMEAFAYWAQHIVTFQPDAASFISGAHPLIYKLDVVIGLTIFLLFPFTRLVHIWSAPIFYLKRMGYLIVRRKSASPL